MMSTLIMRHLPALLIATPLLAAFLMPIVGAAEMGVDVVANHVTLLVKG